MQYELGRTDDARTAYRAAITAGERGQRNISQAINFAGWLEAEGRPGEAIDLLRATGPDLTPHGHMAVASVMACAAEQLGDANALGLAMTYLREHERDNVAARARALLCVNDIDSAAALYVRRLRDPVEYADALLELQIYRAPAHQLPGQAIRAQRRARLRERPEVRAAVGAVGRIEEVPLPRSWDDRF